MEVPGHAQEYVTLGLPFIQFKPRSRMVPRALQQNRVHKGGHIVVGDRAFLSENVTFSIPMSF